MALTLANGLVTYAGSGFPTLDATIVETFNRDDILPDHKQYMSLMGYTLQPLLNPSQTFSSKSAPTGLKKVSETGIAELGDVIFTPKKGIYHVKVARKYARSEDFTDWAKIGKNIEGAPDSIQAELLLASEQVRDLSKAFDITLAEEMVKVYAKGFSITASNGPGSATPKGKALFASDHTYGVPGTSGYGTFSNVLNGALTFDANNATDINNGVTRLQNLIDLLKQTRDENGKYIRQGGVYKLHCSRIRSVFWKAVINSRSKFSGTGNNAMKENQFLFDGNIVEIAVLDLLGQTDSDDTLIGTTDMIFVTNSEILQLSKGLKYWLLKPLTIESWVNQESKVINTDGRASLGVDHFGIELYIAGSTCAA